jgi:hypothetical protein
MAYGPVMQSNTGLQPMFESISRYALALGLE